MSQDIEADEYDEDGELILISKSQLKRESQALQDLGEALVELPSHQLALIPMPEELADAVALARKITARGGRKRQLQYIGKIMRRVEAEPIQQAVDNLAAGSAREIARLHRLESWRDRLLAEGDAALGELLDEYPTLDRQHLRQLIRNGQKELAQQKPPKSAREIFRYLREAMG